MSGSRPIFDGLWRCLCPSVDPVIASRLLQSPTLPRSIQSTTRRAHSTCPRAQPRSGRAQSRNFSSTAPAAALRQQQQPSKSHPQTSSNDAARRLLGAASPKDLDPKALEAASTPDLFEVLDALKDRPNGFLSAAAILKYLVLERGEAPTPQMYEYLVACARDSKSSADMLAQLFSEMKEGNVTITPRLSHLALQVRIPIYYRRAFSFSTHAN